MWRVILFCPLLALAAVSLAAVNDPKTPPVPSLPPASDSPARTTAPAPSLTRGALLYENHCQGCHESRLHVRDQRRAKARAALRAWVTHWAAHQKLGWGEAEIDDVVDYLSRRYYKLPPDRAR
jgi:mono/diheme cytochrome c family protein